MPRADYSDAHTIVKLRIEPPEEAAAKRKLAAEAFLEASLDCHWWKVQFMSLAGKVSIITLCAIVTSSALGNTVMSCGPFDKETSVATREQTIAAAKRAWLSVYSKASWHAIYGPGSFISFEPYSAFLDEGIWRVRNGEKRSARPCRVQQWRNIGAPNMID